MSQHQGFTLIELLIVVAIIAILAAIAVPNFLEAQVRAKVSRGKADMRSIATAIEAYAVDWNVPPPGVVYMQTGACVPRPYKGQDEMLRCMAQARLTTPVAYMTTIPLDPFKDRGSTIKSGGVVSYVDRRVFAYQSFAECMGGNYRKCFRIGYTWALRCVGPWRVESGAIADTLLGTITTNPYDTRVSYDPSNGTVSPGWILRTNKGEFTVAQ